MTTQAPGGALDGLRVLDMSRVMAGPLAGQILADLGADVIKVERPGRGDDTREWAPPFVADPPPRPLDDSVCFWTCNRGKRSVVADIAVPEGQALVARLAATSDVLIENYKVGTLAKYGLDYPTLSAANPRLVYCSITGFGQTGPYAPRPGYDTIVQGMGGLMSITGNPDDAPGGGPRKSGIAVADQMTALYADVAILAALRERDRSGLGQHIDMALLDVQVAGLTNLGLGYLATGRVPPRAGNRLATVYPSDSFRCADGDLMIIVGNDAQFRSFCAALRMPEVSADARFARNAGRLRHADVLAPLIGQALRDRSLAECQALFDAAGVPASPINTLAQVFADPQVIARGLVREVARPDGPPVRVIANPIRMSRTPPRSDRPAPRLGEHTDEVAAKLP
ncbi:CoA transferase [Dankookia rubra]|uniref:CoA transferase n=1 Tax=Dankookia rubra TaxID=1442381 RepID=A0A4R5QAQ9_9PROT|nr:CaiB/BaiF CoA-transferase family protein [Dankookia rubra]TDH60154.1 CoA transferase [Dankookia rubra]